MPQNEDVETAKSLLQIKSASRVIYYIFNTIFICCCLFLVILLAACIVSEFIPNMFFDVNANLLSILTMLITGSVVATLFKLVTNVFRDVARGTTPFTLIQVKRIRIAALIIALDALFGAILSPGFLSALQLGGLNIGYTVIGHPSIPIDLGEILAAVCLLCLSFVFKYGVLLQKFSDETL